MTDRERWIVYPLLFFALGASLRDKILERVDTKQLVCESLLIRNPDGSGIPLAALRAGIDPTRLDGKPIAFLKVDKFLCEGLYIADEEDPTNILVSLGTGTLLDKEGFAVGERVGTLELRDASGEKRCEVSPNNIRSKELVCEKLLVTNEDDPTKVLAALGTGRVPSMPGEDPSEPVGALVLRDADGSQMSELRPDQILGNRIACKQLVVVDPVEGRPRVIAATYPVPGLGADGTQTIVDHEGIIILNETPLVVHPRAAANRPAAPQSP